MPPRKTTRRSKTGAARATQGETEAPRAKRPNPRSDASKGSRKPTRATGKTKAARETRRPNPGNEIDGLEESILHLHWEGRRSYRSSVPTPRVLRPDPKHSFDSEKAGNLIIEGDNLQVMVSLQSQFADAIDIVYIDP